jgi:hypothetical protein
MDRRLGEPSPFWMLRRGENSGSYRDSNSNPYIVQSVHRLTNFKNLNPAREASGCTATEKLYSIS